ncbi:protein draper [Magallana gigas]|uniref:EGF-like domain-containing protein n=1 Tax=Magallana gigas TaxID=29159 RepID=K1S540_MAGGI|nr:protein draper [Crassostrea gigas]|eukprot:XP_011420978.1 PREDICTED: protein draper [Crassostrea gigas]
MQGLRLLLLSAIICVQVKYSCSVKEFFKDCADNNDCPDDSSCISIGTNRQCQCDNGYDAIDLPVTSGGEPVTVCKDLGPCSPFDGVETDCGINGDCVAFRNDYGGMLAACRCKNGYFGRSCDRTGPSTYLPPYTTRRPYVTTRRPGSNIGAIIPAIGGGVLLLALLAGGAAALASSTG